VAAVASSWQGSSEILFFDLDRDLAQLQSLPGAFDDFGDIAFHPSGGMFAYSDYFVHVGRYPDGGRLFSFGRDGRCVDDPDSVVSPEGLWHALAFTPDGKSLIAGSPDGSIYSWSLATGSVEREVHAHAGAVFSLAIDRQGRWLVSAGEDGAVCRWHLGDRRGEA
jgi:WD40 repeat protein